MFSFSIYLRLASKDQRDPQTPNSNLPYACWFHLKNFVAEQTKIFGNENIGSLKSKLISNFQLTHVPLQFLMSIFRYFHGSWTFKIFPNHSSFGAGVLVSSRWREERRNKGKWKCYSIANARWVKRASECRGYSIFDSGNFQSTSSHRLFLFILATLMVTLVRSHPFIRLQTLQYIRQPNWIDFDDQIGYIGNVR